MTKDQLIKQIKSTSVSMVFDAMIKLGYKADKVLMSDIRPVVNLEKLMVGVARTMKYEISRDFPTLDDLTIAREGVDGAAPGEVLVQDGSGYMLAFFGGIFARRAKTRGMIGAVVNGCTRDVLEIKAMGLHVFAKGATPAGGSLYFRPVAVNTRVNCGGIQVEPGDLIVGDSDGVVVIPSDTFGPVSEALRNISEKEKKAVKALKGGKSLVKSYPTIEIGKIKV
jgi:4-hydroxy-4-methyl-2-oxoglutarate aldolase